jgi:predicted enzyme related to lactoylglutathione lyase
VIWADLVTPDAERAKQFYGALFGWTFRETPAKPKGYTLALLDGKPVAGLVQRTEPPGERHQPAWLTFISTKDVDETMGLAKAHGGKVISGPYDYPGRGRQAMLSDPDGAAFAVLSSSSGDPPDVMAAPGSWIWSSLITHDPDAQAAFYQTLFGYDVFDSGTGEDTNPLQFASNGYARACANSLPGDASKYYPHWLNYVRVVDVPAAVAKAVELGGRALVEPRPNQGNGRMAVVADPAGAAIGLFEWTGTGKESSAQ